jgi:hypothetical protein
LNVSPRLILIYTTSILGALLAAYGASYGVRANNGVLVVGAAAVLLAAIAEYRSRRQVAALLAAIAVVAGFFGAIGLSTLNLPACPPPAGSVACVADGARERTVLALTVFTLIVVALGVRATIRSR